MCASYQVQIDRLSMIVSLYWTRKSHVERLHYTDDEANWHETCVVFLPMLQDGFKLAILPTIPPSPVLLEIIESPL